MANQYTDHQYELFKEQINMFKETCTDYSEEDLFELAYDRRQRYPLNASRRPSRSVM